MTELKLTFKLNIFCQPILGQDKEKIRKIEKEGKKEKEKEWKENGREE